MTVSTSGPLRSARIVITRPARQAAGLAQQIAVLGGKPVMFPAIVILPPADRSALERAQRDLAQYDYAVFVSANAVEYGVGDPASWPAHLIALAPGPGTASALAAVGIGKVHIPATTMDSEGLLALPELADVSDKRIVIYRGNGGRELLGETLSERGAQIDYVECYRRAKPHGDFATMAAAWRAGELDALTLTSSEGLDNLWELFDSVTRTSMAATPTFVPHPRIAERARTLGFDRVSVTAPTDAGLLASLLEYFASGQT
ncbi:MAG TPA: uroporphyrinogen-III synthase [Casimicrobiaceae bacterium]|jgi:uroporphyrinogen-III synthase|nr:uroporphyrinogen-III synthase [Casimicrobiaceae bacterium]